MTMVDLTTLSHTEPPLPTGASLRLGDARLRHPYSHVRGLAFLPHNDLIASGGGRTLRFWSARNGHLQHHIHTAAQRGHSSIRAMALSPNGTRLAIRDDGISLWDTRSGERVARFEDIQRVGETLTFTPDGARLIADDSDFKNLRLVIIDVASMTALHHLPHSEIHGFEDAAVSSQGLAVTTDGKALRVWDIEGGLLLAKIPNTSFSLKPARLLFLDPQTLVVGYSEISGDARSMVRFHIQRDGFRISLEERNTTDRPVNTQALALSPRGLIAAADRTGNTLLFDATTFDHVHTFEDTFGRNRLLSFSADGKHLTTAGYEEIRVFDMSDYTPAMPPTEGHRGAVFDIAFNDDNARLASTSEDFRLLLWDLESGTRLSATNIPGVNADARHKSSRAFWILRSGAILAVELKTTCRVDANTGERLEDNILKTPDDILDSDILRNHNRYAVGVKNGLLAEQNYHDGTVTHQSFPLPDHQICALSYVTEDLLWVAWRREDGRPPADPLSFVRLRDVNTSVRINPDFGPHIPDGAPPYTQLEAGYDRLFYAQREDGRIDLFRSPEQGVINFVHTLGVAHRILRPDATADFQRHLRPTMAVPAYARLERLATTTTDGNITLFDAPGSSTQSRLLTTPWHWTHRLAFSRDGTRLAASGSDGTILIWDLPEADETDRQT